jgi:hypothetical protein
MKKVKVRNDKNVRTWKLFNTMILLIKRKPFQKKIDVSIAL